VLSTTGCRKLDGVDDLFFLHLQQLCALLTADTLRHFAPQNALSSSDPKFRRVRQSNAVFQARLGRYPEALEVLHMAGFHEVADPEPALALKRDDPGLLWLTLAAVKDSLVH